MFVKHSFFIRIGYRILKKGGEYGYVIFNLYHRMRDNRWSLDMV